MDSQRHGKLTEIFARASALDREKRAGYLDEACAGDVELRTEIESLVAIDEPARSQFAVAQSSTTLTSSLPE